MVQCVIAEKMMEKEKNSVCWKQSEDMCDDWLKDKNVCVCVYSNSDPVVSTAVCYLFEKG